MVHDENIYYKINLFNLDLISLPDNIRYCKQLTSVDCSSNRLERSIELFCLKK